jgi:ammonium transporter, Amt family
MLGTFILWFGWYGFNGGSALLGLGNSESNKLAALAATNTTISAGVSGITALMANLWYLERTTGEAYFDITYAMNGCLAGLVAITGGCGVVEPWAAIIIGMGAGLTYLIGSHLLIKLRLDDAVDAIPVHLASGTWGVTAVGLFASPTHLMEAYGRNDHPGLFYSWWNGNSDGTLLGVQFIGILFICGWVMVIMLPFFVWLDWKGWFRSDPLEEIVGLDLSYHGGIPLLNHGGDEAVNPDYISAYKKRQEERSRARMSRYDTRTERSNRDEADMDSEQEEEMEEF